MGKAEVGSAKYISNKLKAKGLSKLKFYCQICEKQCRDDNGFKCHILSKSHNDKISQLSHHTIDEYSKDFENSFLKLLRLNHSNKFINANKYYQEYIMDKEHVHLNSTKWKSLTLFCIYCQDTNKLQVRNGEGPEEHLQIRYIDRYKESLINNGQQDKIEKDTSLKYMELQILRNKQILLEQNPAKEVKTLADSNMVKPINITIKDKVYDKEINKCGMMVKPVKPGSAGITAVKFNRVANPKLKPRKGNVFKTKDKESV